MNGRPKWLREELMLIPAHDVAQFLQVGRGEVPVVPVTALDILIYTVQIQGVQVQKFLLKQKKQD